MMGPKLAKEQLVSKTLMAEVMVMILQHLAKLHQKKMVNLVLLMEMTMMAVLGKLLTVLRQKSLENKLRRLRTKLWVIVEMMRNEFPIDCISRVGENPSQGMRLLLQPS